MEESGLLGVGRSCALLCLIALCGYARFASAVETELQERAAALHQDAVVVDGHNDVAIWITDFGFDLAMNGWEREDRSGWLHLALPWLPGSPTADRLRTHTDLGRIEAGGLDAQFFSVWVSPEHYDVDEPVPGSAVSRANEVIDVLERQVERHPDRLAIARTSGDIRQISSSGRHAMLLGLEGGHAIEDSLESLRHFHRRGVRYMTLTWSFSHSWADAAGDPLQEAKPRHGGLTDFGRRVVREMNDLGMLVDVSHVSDDTFWDVLEVARAPVIASHSSVRAIAEHPRNLSDEMLRAVATNGGVVMINFSVLYLDPRKTTPAKLTWDWIVNLGGSDTSVSNVADHIDHVVRIAGVDHVGLGSDFDGTPFLPQGLAHVGELPNLTLELMRRGHSEADVRKILGGNLLRVLSRAEDLQRPPAAQPGAAAGRRPPGRADILSGSALGGRTASVAGGR